MRELCVDWAEQMGKQSEIGVAPPYHYSILVDEMDVGGFACESYGVCVTMADGSARTAIPNITISVSRIDELMELLMRNKVGPISLKDAVDDWL